MKRSFFLAALIGGSICASAADAPTLVSWFGKSPAIDGKIEKGEWADATRFEGVKNWTPEFSPVTDDKDLKLAGYVKHDDEWLYFGFEITDDVLYGIDTERWLPKENPRAHELSREGYPWFGDEMELLINAPGTWTGSEGAAGDGASWQMVCNLTKSRLAGVGQGGLLEGEPRTSQKAWDTYQRWIKEGAQKAVARKSGNHSYVIEWAVRFNPCLEIAPGRFYSAPSGEAKMGLNIAVGDLDEPAKGTGNFGNFHHEQWFSGKPHTRTDKREWGWLILKGTKRNPATAK